MAASTAGFTAARRGDQADDYADGWQRADGQDPAGVRSEGGPPMAVTLVSTMGRRRRSP